MLAGFTVKRRNGAAVAHVIDASSPGNCSCLFSAVLDACLVGLCGYTFEFGWGSPFAMLIDWRMSSWLGVLWCLLVYALVW
eukprot:9187405-Pyramimonas_sp.AAC.1